MPIEIVVDRQICQGAKACVRRGPGTFSLDAEGRSVVAAEPEDDESTIRAAAQACPFFAIVVRQVQRR